jgi:hypothetical protein
MDRTLFTPPMIETFRVCRRAYQMAFLAGRQPNKEPIRLSTLCKRFLLRALSEINRARITSMPAVQKYLGQNWPSEKLAAEDDLQGQERSIQAFRFVYRILSNYIANPYKPKGAEVCGVSLKVRARVPHTKAYLEDTFDLILWHPERRTLELVDFHLSPLKPFDPAWPAPTLLVRHFLAQRLKVRWPFEKLVFTFCQLHTDGLTPISIELDEAVTRLHWPELLKTINDMKSEEEFAPHRSAMCKRCHFLTECLAMGPKQEKPDVGDNSVSMSA